MAVTRLSLLPEFSTSAAVPVWVVEVLVMVCDSTGACEPMPEVSMSVAGLSVAEGVGVTMMKPSLASSGSGSGSGVGSGVGSGLGAGDVDGLLSSSSSSSFTVGTGTLGP